MLQWTNYFAGNVLFKHLCSNPLSTNISLLCSKYFFATVQLNLSFIHMCRHTRVAARLPHVIIQNSTCTLQFVCSFSMCTSARAHQRRITQICTSQAHGLYIHYTCVRTCTTYMHFTNDSHVPATGSSDSFSVCISTISPSGENDAFEFGRYVSPTKQ